VSRKAGEKVIVGLSGGVDSAVAALLLRDQGFDVEGLFMANWDDPDPDTHCTTATDFQDARAVCAELGIVLHRIDFSAQYREQVFAAFLKELRAGRTPNPDVLCNREIKFGVCLEYVRRLGSQRFATGHYARLVAGDQGIELHKGRDPDKDQSYFLHAVDGEHLEAAIFPLGEFHKSEVRERARTAGLPVFDKPDSTGICFIGERHFAAFLAQWLPDAPGPILAPDGTLLGQHRGLHHYTLGQRGGLGIGGRAGGPESPWYVARKDPQGNRLIAVQGPEHPLLFSEACRVVDWHWVGRTDAQLAAAAPHALRVKLRYRQPDQGLAEALWQGAQARLVFAARQRAVTPGQYAVVYRETRCLGGGVIEETTPVTESRPGAVIMPLPAAR
jgi:tRNA-specific 2-thiouridylase